MSKFRIYSNTTRQSDPNKGRRLLALPPSWLGLRIPPRVDTSCRSSQTIPGAIAHPNPRRGTRLSKSRAVFVTMSPLLSDIVRDLLSDKVGLYLVDQIGDREMLAERLPGLQPDLVVIGLSSGEGDDIGRFVLQVVPSAKVLAISSNGRDAYLHEMRLHRRLLLDFSPANLLSAIVAPDSPARE